MSLSPRFRNIISGKCPKFTSRLLRLALHPLAALYSSIISLRNLLYDKGLLNIHRLPVPVICVGNLTVGGTGKTPLVLWLCRFFQEHNIAPAILTRGYQGTYDNDNDEIRLLKNALPDIPIIIDSDRVRGGQTALQTHKPQVLIMDDGFQHRRLHRDLDIVLIDCTCPFGYNYLLPRGLLREPQIGLSRAHLAFLTRSDLIDSEQLENLKQQVQQLLVIKTLTVKSPEKLTVTCQHQPTALFDKSNKSKGLEHLSGKNVLAFCGLGNPSTFLTTLQSLGINVVAHHFFADHCHYTPQDINFLRDLSNKNDYDGLITTEKDWVKLRQLSNIQELKNLYWLRIEMKILENQSQLEDRLVQICRKIQPD